MKKFVLSLFILLGSAGVSMAQSFLTEHGDTVMANYTTGGPLVHNNVKSASSAPVTLRWSIIASNVASGWTFAGFCDNVSCYTTNVLDGTLYTTDPYSDQWGLFEAQFNGDNATNNSVAWVQVQVEDVATSYTRTLTFIATKYATSVSGISKGDEGVSLYPNPARNNVNVVFDPSLGVKNIAVYNLIGKPVKVFKVNGNSAKLEISEIPAGIYFLRLINANGQIVATRKFTHQ